MQVLRLTHLQTFFTVHFISWIYIINLLYCPHYYLDFCCCCCCCCSCCCKSNIKLYLKILRFEDAERKQQGVSTNNHGPDHLGRLSGTASFSCPAPQKASNNVLQKEDNTWERVGQWMLDAISESSGFTRLYAPDWSGKLHI